MKISRPTEKEYNIASYQHRYIQTVNGDDAFATMKENLKMMSDFFKNIPTEKLHYRYAEGKWTPLEVLGHIVDTERVLAYRAISIARGDSRSLMGFDENLFATTSNADKQSLRALLQQFVAQRKASIMMFKSFGKRDLSRMGNANGLPTNARVLAWFIAGHELHHLNILQERYL